MSEKNWTIGLSFIILKSFSFFEDLIKSKMSNLGCGKWQCLECGFISKSTNVSYHIESKHIISAGYNCSVCSRFCRTRNALSTHMSLKHKNTDALE